jgi:hypothetical protein
MIHATPALAVDYLQANSGNHRFFNNKVWNELMRLGQIPLSL